MGALLDLQVQALQDQLLQDQLDQLVQALLDQPAQALLDQPAQDLLVAQLFLLLLFLLPQQSRNQQNQQNRVADKLKEDNLAIRYIGSNIQIYIYIYMNDISLSAFRQYFHSPFPSSGVISKKMDL